MRSDVARAWRRGGKTHEIEGQEVTKLASDAGLGLAP
jgi:hypothetical protein